MDIRVSGAYSAYSVPPARGKHAVNRSNVEHTRSASDSVSISSQASDYQVARRAIQNTPDVRADFVSRIKEQIAAGTYNVSASDVAARIFHG